MKSILIMGAPGTGKGTLAQRLKENSDLYHIATGDIFRENIKAKTPVGIKALKYIEQAMLVPDEITDEMVRLKLAQENVQSKTILLDGYPRNLHQASKIIELLNGVDRKIDLIIWLDTPEEIIIDRICHRRLCKQCGQVYNTKNKPSTIAGQCDKCNSALYQRDDDKKVFVVKRLSEYKEVTSPLIDFYKDKASIIRIDTSSENLEDDYEKLKAIISA